MSAEPDDQQPHDARRSRKQIVGMLSLLGARPRRVLDLGCGAGRVLLPLLKAGHRVIGVDREARVLEHGVAAAALMARRLPKDNAATRGASTSEQWELVQGDFVDGWSALAGKLRRRTGAALAGSFDAVCCLGNTFMHVSDIDDAAALLRRVARLLAPGGWFVIDDIPHDLWPELTAGNWQAGVSDDGSMQLVWEEADNVLAIRRGRAVDRRSSRPRAGDQRLRLWTMGELRLLAGVAGLSAPSRDSAAALLLLRRPRR